MINAKINYISLRQRNLSEIIVRYFHPKDINFLLGEYCEGNKNLRIQF